MGDKDKLDRYFLRKNRDGENESDTTGIPTCSGGRNSGKNTGELTIEHVMSAISQLRTELTVSIKETKNEIIEELSNQYEGRLTDIQTSLELAHHKIQDLEKENANLQSKLKVEIDSNQLMENKMIQLTADILNVKRYTREFNVRVYTIKEEKNENCRMKLVDFIQRNNLLPGKDKQAVSHMLEYVHRTGKREKGKSRHIIARLHSREVRNTLVQNGKRKGPNGNNLVAEDFTKEDYQKRKIALLLMKQAYGEGKKAKFTKGQLIIDGEVVEMEPIY